MDYSSLSGLSTKHWGKPAWYFLFSCIMGAYPPQFDPRNKNHLETKKHFKNMFTSIGYTMPCIYCRNSYKEFTKELPIEKFMSGRGELMKWLYLVKDKVNKKLIGQEKHCYDNDKKKLKHLYHSGNLSEEDYYIQVKALKKNTFVTIPSPPFEEVLQQYESIRATCSDKSKTCSIKK
jgi:hypothetical protein